MACGTCSWIWVIAPDPDPPFNLKESWELSSNDCTDGCGCDDPYPYLGLFDGDTTTTDCYGVGSGGGGGGSGSGGQCQCCNCGKCTFIAVDNAGTLEWFLVGGLASTCRPGCTCGGIAAPNTITYGYDPIYEGEIRRCGCAVPPDASSESSDGGGPGPGPGGGPGGGGPGPGPGGGPGPPGGIAEALCLDDDDIR